MYKIKNYFTSKSILVRVIIVLLLFVIISITQSSCEKFLDVGVPRNNIVAEAVFKSSTSAAGVLTGMYPDLYTMLSGTEFFMRTSLMADDFVLTSQSLGLKDYYINNASGEYWGRFYVFIYRINSAIEGLNNSDGLPVALKNQLLGEAYFLRGFFYFYLVNLYGEVPLIIKSDYKENLTKSRSPVEDVYALIVEDLLKAKENLSEDYLNADMITVTPDRVRPTKYAAIALLARVYLHKGDWEKAETESGALIENTTRFELDSLNGAFIKNSKESIWQLKPANFVGFNTQDARIFVLTNGPGEFRPVYLNTDLIESFENQDLRKLNWIGVNTFENNVYHYAFKYKLNKVADPEGEYYTLLRLAEQYLIRSEARAQMNNIDGGLIDLNMVRARAGLNALDNLTKDSLLEAILNERRHEYFSECAHRWFDIKRMGKVDDIMPSVCASKGGQWSSYKQLLPIPGDDIRMNPNLTQNPGYPLQ